MTVQLLPTLVCSHRQGLTLCADQVPDSLRALMVERGTCPNAGALCCGLPAIGVVGGIAGEQDQAPGERLLSSALHDYGTCVENQFGHLLSGPHLEQTLVSGGLYMGLSTRTAYRLEPARLFSHTLAERLGLTELTRENVELALHEAVVNGILHGNLDISSDGRDSLEGFSEYCRKIEDRLEQPGLADRLIEIYAVWDDGSFTLSVADCGEGYDPAALPSHPDLGGKSGRGLFLIRQMAQDVQIEDHGRLLHMRFVR